MPLHPLVMTVVWYLCMAATTLSTSVFAQTPEDSIMTVSDGNTISIEYTLTLDDRNIVDTNVGKEPLVFTQGKHQIISGLEHALAGMKKGERKQVTVSPEQAYGISHPEAIHEVPMEKIPEEARKVGMTLQGQDAQGRIARPRVIEVKEDVVVLDFNHPLAGKTLNFDVKILDIQAPPPAS